jgi:FdhE protein
LPVKTSALIRHLEERERKEGKLPRVLEFYLKLLRVQDRIEQKLAPRLQPGLDREAIKRRIERGAQLIAFDELALDWPLLRETFAEIVAIFADYADLFSAHSESLRELKADAIVTEETVKAWFEKQRLRAKLSARGADKAILSAILHATIKPFLVSHAETLIDSIDQERWRRGYCPICGGSPDFAFLDKERGTRWLACSRCDTEWVFQRLQCPYCGTQDQNALAYFTDDEGLYRLYTCQHCKSYLKTIDLRKTEGEVFLPLERLFTLDMDRQGREKGFSAGRLKAAPKRSNKAS